MLKERTTNIVLPVLQSNRASRVTPLNPNFETGRKISPPLTTTFRSRNSRFSQHHRDYATTRISPKEKGTLNTHNTESMN